MIQKNETWTHNIVDTNHTHQSGPYQHIFLNLLDRMIEMSSILSLLVGALNHFRCTNCGSGRSSIQIYIHNNHNNKKKKEMIAQEWRKKLDGKKFETKIHIG